MPRGWLVWIEEITALPFWHYYGITFLTNKYFNWLGVHKEAEGGTGIFEILLSIYVDR